MVSKANSTKGSTQAIDYILSDKGQAVELDRNLVSGSNGKEILDEMRFVQSANRNCVNNTISIILSPGQDIGKNLQPDEMREILGQHLENLGLKDHQWIATVHQSTDTQHIHVIANRIAGNGKALDDSFISRKAQSSAEQIAQGKGWKTAKEVALENGLVQKAQTKDIYTHIAKHLKAYKPQNKEQYLSMLQKEGFKVEICSSKSTGKISGYKIDGFKASDISRGLTFNALDRSLKVFKKVLSIALER